MPLHNKFEGGNHTHHHNYPSQQDLKLESLSDKPIPVKFTDTEKDHLKEEAEQRQIGVSKLVREIVRDYQNIRPMLAKLRGLLNEL